MSQEVKYVRVLLGYHGSANCGESALGQVYFDALTDITDGETDEPLTEEEIIAWAEEEFEEYEIFDQPVRFDTLTGKRGQYRSNRPDMETITQAQIKSEEA